MTIVKVSRFTGATKEDKNGKFPVYLSYVSGEPLPENSRVISGTVSENSGFEVGANYMVDVVSTGTLYKDKPQFNVNNIAPVTGADLLNLFSKDLSKTQRLTTAAPVAEKAHAGAAAEPKN